MADKIITLDDYPGCDTVMTFSKLPTGLTAGPIVKAKHLVNNVATASLIDGGIPITDFSLVEGSSGFYTSLWLEGNAEQFKAIYRKGNTADLFKGITLNLVSLHTKQDETDEYGNPRLKWATRTSIAFTGVTLKGLHWSPGSREVGSCDLTWSFSSMLETAVSNGQNIVSGTGVAAS